MMNLPHNLSAFAAYFIYILYFIDKMLIFTNEHIILILKSSTPIKNKEIYTLYIVINIFICLLLRLWQWLSI